MGRRGKPWRLLRVCGYEAHPSSPCRWSPSRVPSSQATCRAKVSRDPTWPWANAWSRFRAARYCGRPLPASRVARPWSSPARAASVCAYETDSQARPTSAAGLGWCQRRGAAHSNGAESEAAGQAPLPRPAFSGTCLRRLGDAHTVDGVNGHRNTYKRESSINKTAGAHNQALQSRPRRVLLHNPLNSGAKADMREVRVGPISAIYHVVTISKRVRAIHAAALPY